MRLARLAIFAASGIVLAKPPPPPPKVSMPMSGPGPIQVSHTATGTCAEPSAQATARTDSSTSNVKGIAFDRILQVMLETTSFGNATTDQNCKALIDRGLLLTNMYGVAAPSQPNYIAPGSGDTFGVNSDSFILVDKNISTIVDLLEDKGVSWSDYNEGLPYTGFEGYVFDPGLYERKHNLMARFDSIRLVPERNARVKNLTYFYVDLENEEVPQWSFVTPNLYNDGHNSNHRISCAWTRGFVESLLQNPYFNRNALIYVAWQANGDAGGEKNHVAGILLGSALPKELKGTTDNNYYNHYSHMATVEANWGLHTLGRWDVGANVWKFVGEKTGDPIRKWSASIAGDSFGNFLWNQSYGGVFSNANSSHLYVAPNLNLVRNGRTVLPAVKEAWSGSSLPSYYKDQIEIPDGYHPPKGYEVPLPNLPPPPITTPIRVYPAAHPPPIPAMLPCPPPPPRFEL